MLWFRERISLVCLKANIRPHHSQTLSRIQFYLCTAQICDSKPRVSALGKQPLALRSADR